ncbi:MAG TPA: hypothetical protein VGD84_13590, partial [Pseudonocardiaceae bacterium]
MIVCRDCGYRNVEGDTFCGSCGKFLEWAGEKVTVTVDKALVEEAKVEAAQPRRGLMQRVSQAASRLIVGPAPDGT